MATVTNDIILPDGTVPTEVKVRIRLIASLTGSGIATAYETSTGTMIESEAKFTTTTGAWSRTMVENADITPAGTYYEILETAGRFRYRHIISVTGSGSVSELLTEAPTAIEPAGWASLLDGKVAVAGDSMTGRLNVEVGAEQAIFAKSTGVVESGAHVITAYLAADGGDNQSALNVVSDNTANSAMFLSGVELDRGTLKISHEGTGTDASAAALSIDLAGTGTAAQGVYITSTDGGTTGNLITVRHNSRDDFVVKSTGRVGIGMGIAATPGGVLEVKANNDTDPSISVKANSTGAANLIEFKRSSDGAVRTRVDAQCQLVSSQVAFFAGAGVQFGSTTTDFGGGSTPVLGVDNASTAPTTNPTAGVIIYSEGGFLKFRDPNGNVHLCGADLAGDSLPRDNGLIAWSYDPAAAVNNTAITAGVVYITKVVVPTDTTITNVVAYVVTAGTSLTSSQNFAALFDSGGTQRGITADQSGVWNTTGSKTMALASPYAATAGVYYVALLANHSGTSPAFARSVGTAVGNVNLSAGSFRFATSGTGQTAMPGSITLGSAGNSGIGLWVGVS